jgi:hypothetical protein
MMSLCCRAGAPAEMKPTCGGGTGRVSRPSGQPGLRGRRRPASAPGGTAARARARPHTSHPTRPAQPRTLRLLTPSARCFLTTSPPRKSNFSRLRLPTVHARPASTGVSSSVRSLPYRHRPASRRSESRAPRPAGGARQRVAAGSGGRAGTQQGTVARGAGAAGARGGGGRPPRGGAAELLLLLRRRALTAEPDGGRGQHGLGHLLRLRKRDGQLEAVLARVAGAGDPARHARHVKPAPRARSESAGGLVGWWARCSGRAGPGPG